MTQRPPKRWPAHKYLAIGSIALMILIAGFGAWSVLAQISGAVVATGQIEGEHNRHVIQHPDGGTVQDIYVQEGSRVRAGDLLLRLDSATLQSELAVVEAQLFAALTRHARLEAERDNAAKVTFDTALLPMTHPAVQALMAGQERLFAARLETKRSMIAQLTLRRTQIESQRSGIAAQKDALLTQRELIAQELADQQSLLDRGLAQAGPVLALRRQDAALRGSIGALTAQNAQAAERMTEIDLQILALATSRREAAIAELRDLAFTQVALAERRRTLRRQLEQRDIRAPVSGVVYGLRFFAPRSVVRPADTVLFIVPQNQSLVIATRVAVTDVDQVFVGQDVTVRLPALDQRRTPELRGKVTLISADTFLDEMSRSPYYRVEVQLGHDQLARLASDMTLMPGMPVQTFMRTAERSPLSYLTKPLTDYFTNALRES